jgi:2',3'-cyclic-nucleotide 2'-phosphodiesterase/3'-nucleotidase/5'-nucleotidase
MSAQSDASGGHFNSFHADPRGTRGILSGLLNDRESGEGHSRAGHGHGKPKDDASGIELSRLGTFDSGLGEASAEIVAHDPASQRLFVTNSNAATVDILDAADPSQPVKLASIDVSVIDGTETGGPNSVAVAGGIVAVAVEAAEVTDPGKVAFFDVDGGFLGAVEVGALPDMLTFAPDGSRVLVANEGEPGELNSKGSVSIVDISNGIGAAVVTTVDFTAFDAQQAALEAAGLRIFDGQVLSDDVEPEHIAVRRSPSSSARACRSRCSASAPTSRSRGRSRRG